jgi:hypothetical protein
VVGVVVVGVVYWYCCCRYHACYGIARHASMTRYCPVSTTTINATPVVGVVAWPVSIDLADWLQQCADDIAGWRMLHPFSK